MSYLDRDPYGMYRTPSDSGPGPRLMGADTLMGEDVSNAQGEDLGDIKEIMLDMQTGEIAYAVLSFGGLMGMGTKLFAVPWQALQLDTTNKRFILDVPKDKLEQAPGFDKDNWPDLASPEFGSQIHSFYNTQQSPTARAASSGSVIGQNTASMQSGRYDSSVDRNNLSSPQSGSLGSSTGQSRQGSFPDTSDVSDLSTKKDDPYI